MLWSRECGHVYMFGYMRVSLRRLLTVTRETQKSWGLDRSPASLLNLRTTARRKLCGHQTLTTSCARSAGSSGSCVHAKGGIVAQHVHEMVFYYNDPRTGETVLKCATCGHEERYRT